MSGMNKYFIPRPAPSKNIPLKNKITNRKYGAIAVKVIILPEVFTPFRMTK
jgi:hypothetical protein